MTQTVLARPALIGWIPWQVQAGWLLRAHRLHHTDPVLQRLTGFAHAYREARHYAGGVSPSSLSRWENGLAPVTASAVRRYEDVLGLSAHRLLAPIQTIARHEGGPAAAVFLRGGRAITAADADPQVEDLLARVLDGGTLTGTDWDDLTQWAAYSGGRVFPGRVRHKVVRRLLEETVVADGISWMRRFEAFSRLMADPLWGPEAIAVSAAVAQQPEHAGAIDAVCALDGSAHPDASRAVLGQLADPTTADAHYGALLAAARKTRKHHFTSAQTRILIDVVDGILTLPQPSVTAAAVEAAAVLLHRLPLSRGHTAQLLASAADRGSAVQAIVAHGSLTDPATAAITVSRVLGRLDDDGVRRQGPSTLDALIDSLLHHPVADARLYAAMMLHASPYGAQIAAALATDLQRPAIACTEARAVPVLHALRVLGGPDQRAVVTDLTLRRGLPQGVALAAVHALAHIGGRSPESYWRAVFHQHIRTALKSTEQHGILKRLVYGFAMSGELDLLSRLMAEQKAWAMSARDLYRWWTDLDHHVRHSAQHH